MRPFYYFAPQDQNYDYSLDFCYKSDEYFSGFIQSLDEAGEISVGPYQVRITKVEK